MDTVSDTSSTLVASTIKIVFHNRFYAILVYFILNAMVFIDGVTTAILSIMFIVSMLLTSVTGKVILSYSYIIIFEHFIHTPASCFKHLPEQERYNKNQCGTGEGG